MAKSRTRSTDPESEPPGQGQPDPQQQEQAGVVCRSVLQALGRPRDLFRISAVRLWENQYRVNVQTGPDAVSARVAHSFFVAVDEKGAVVESNPQLTRVY